MRSFGNTRVKVTAGIIVCAAVLAGTAAAVSASTALLGPASSGAITEAMTAEYKAMALYKATASKFKGVLPYTHWAKSDRDDDLEGIFSKYGVAVPADAFAGKVPAPASLAEACRAAKQTETGLIGMYDRLLKAVKEADIIAAFTEMRDQSECRIKTHLSKCN